MIGGKPADLSGNWFEPTILTGVEQSSEIVQEEVFGPVLTLQTFHTEDEAVELANGTEYGLAATLFTSDEARAERVAAQLVAGTVWTNCFYVRDLAAPFGGSRKSGVGREGGAWSFDFFSDVKNIARSEEPTSELQSLKRISYAVFRLKKKTTTAIQHYPRHINIPR